MAGESFPSVTLTAVTTAANVRSLTGYTEDRDIDTTSLNAIILRAQMFVVQDLGAKRHNIPLWGTIDGSNVRFELDPRYRDRVFLDLDLSGDEKNDALVYLRQRPVGAAPATYVSATISSMDALHAQVVLTSAPSPTTTDAVLLTAWLVRAPIVREHFQYVVELYAAHLADKRIRGPGNVNLTNPAVMGKDQAPIGNRWLGMYRDEVRKLRGTLPLVASVRTGLRNRRAFDALDPDWTAYHGTSP